MASPDRIQVRLNRYVVRGRGSIVRSLTQEEKTGTQQNFGHDKEEYDKIVERVLGERLVSQSVEGLKERLKMLNFMYQDCLDMVDKWEKDRMNRIQASRRRDPRFYLLAFCGLVISLCGCFLFVRIIL